MASVLEEPGTAALGQGVLRLARIGGAVLSVALVAGVAIWGYRLMVRDVNGIPVVRAMEGPMREQPVDPGGEVNPHRGLAVNEIAAEGEAAPSEDVLMLAPQTGGLAPEDLEMRAMAEAGEVMAEDLAALASEVDAIVPVVATEPEVTLVATSATVVEPGPGLAAGPGAPLTAEQVLAMADEITAGIAPLSELAPGVDAPVAVSVNGAAPLVIISEDIPGVARAFRPPARPGARLGVAAIPGQVEAGAASPPVRVEDLPAGTALVQFGAFDSPELAMTAWDELTTRFGEFLTGREPVIQQANSGGQTFYRLRAIGFADRPDAQRFCATFAAEQRECVPHVVP